MEVEVLIVESVGSKLGKVIFVAIEFLVDLVAVPVTFIPTGEVTAVAFLTDSVVVVVETKTTAFNSL